MLFTTKLFSTTMGLRTKSFSYSEFDTLLGGILINLDFDRKLIERKVYTTIDLLQEIGGFMTALKLVFTIIFPLLRSWSLEKYLIK